MTDNKDLFGPRPGETQSRSGSTGDRHRVHWTEWGDATNPRVLFCAHGLSRNGRDFDYLASALADRYRIICPDYPGRGNSDWLVNKADYHNEQYLLDSIAIIDTLEFQQLDWVGTSMGGLIGMELAARYPELIGKMVINDVGPFIPAEALAVIGEYLGIHPIFSDREEALDYYRTVYAGFGKLDSEHYEHFVNHGVTPARDGAGFVLNYDPAIIDCFVAVKPVDIDLWETWDSIRIPRLVLRGKKSGLLLAQTVEQMKHRADNTESVEFDDCAHAPSLMVSEQIEVISNWL